MTDLWAYTNKVMLAFSRPGKPTDSAYIESLNGSFRDECLNCHWFESLSDAKLKVEACWDDYNKNSRKVICENVELGCGIHDHFIQCVAALC